jgi:hypothetical protein
VHACVYGTGGPAEVLGGKRGESRTRRVAKDEFSRMRFPFKMVTNLWFPLMTKQVPVPDTVRNTEPSLHLLLRDELKASLHHT